SQIENDARPDKIKRIFVNSDTDIQSTGFQADTLQMPKGKDLKIAHSREDTLKPEDVHTEIINKLMEEAQKKEADAYEKGLQEGTQNGIKKGTAQGKKAGYDQGLKDGRQTVDPIIQLFNRAIEDVEDFKKQLYIEAQEEAVKLAIAMTRKIIACEPAINPDVLLNVMRTALGKTDGTEIVRIRIHPTESECLRQGRFDLKISDQVVLVADGAIEPGGCMIETLSGDLNARLQSQLAVLEEAFEQELDNFRNLKTPDE
ncbi:MAG: FliH/SctL family protein, partial [Desulfatirhabdiaceae bacterium]